MASKKMREKIFNLTNGRCFYCGCELELDSYEIDHVIPKSDTHKDSNNRVPACHDCNACKGTLSIEEFRKKIKYLYMYLYEHDNKVRVMMKYYSISVQQIFPDVVFWFEQMNLENERR